MATTKRRPRLEVRTDSRAYNLGDTLTASITIDVFEDTTVREGVVELLCTGHYTGLEGTVGGPLGIRHVQERQRFLTDTRMRGDRRKFQVEFRLPRDAPPTYRRKQVYTVWWVRAKLDIPWAKDVIEEELIDIRRHAYTADSLELAMPKSDSACRLVFDGPSEWIREGEPVEGTLLVTALKDANVRGIWVELSRVEAIYTPSGMTPSLTPEGRTEYTLPRTLRKGEDRRFDFRLRLPAGDRPFLATEAGRGYYELRGVVALEGQKDCVAVAAILAFNNIEK